MSALSEYRIVGPASSGRVRGAGLLDLLAAAIVAMVAFPQPIARAAITGAGLPIVVFVVLLLAIVFAAFWLYIAFAAVTWGRTPGMYLLDLGLEAETKPTLAEASGWAAGWVLAALPALLGVRAAYDPDTGWPARFSHVPTRAAMREVDAEK